MCDVLSPYGDSVTYCTRSYCDVLLLLLQEELVPPARRVPMVQLVLRVALVVQARQVPLVPLEVPVQLVSVVPREALALLAVPALVVLQVNTSST